MDEQLPRVLIEITEGVATGYCDEGVHLLIVDYDVDHMSDSETEIFRLYDEDIRYITGRVFNWDSNATAIWNSLMQ